ncbi:MAG: hypothetical protein JXK16_09560 [Thiotrichales bacterium]|nr:hypothetical protein [Thiotrichales bacterium]
MKDLKPIYSWAVAHGESRIIDRILVRMLPELLKSEQKLTSQTLEQASTVMVSESLYAHFLNVAEELVGQAYQA